MSEQRAAIFDLDGTLVDNMRFHARAWGEMARKLGKEMPLEFFERETAGKKNVEILSQLLGREIGSKELAELGDEKERLYRQLYAPHLAPVPGLIDFLERLRRAGVPCAVATLAPAANRELVLGRLGIAGAFARVLGAEQAPRGKPAPDIYLAAAAALDVPPARCIAFEDAVNGVLAARAAGMEVVGIDTAGCAQALRDAGARWIARDFESLPAELDGALALAA